MGKGRNKLILAFAAALALVALAAPDGRAGIQILAHRQGDAAPQRFQAVVDLGVVGFSFLFTWSRRLQG